MREVTAPCPHIHTIWSKTTLEHAKSELQQPKPQIPSARKQPKAVQTQWVSCYASDSVESSDDRTPKQRQRLTITLADPSVISRPNLGKRDFIGAKQQITDVYEFIERIGTGNFSVVHKVRHMQTGEIFAAKVIGKAKLKDDDLHRLSMELSVLQQVSHPNIITLKEVFETNHMLYIVTELVTGGELFDRIVVRGTYTEKDAAELVTKVIEAIAYLHARGIVHRDIKPENLLLSTKDEDTQVKIADFGLAKILGDSIMMQTACGTPGYVAPEILRAQGYGKEVDMWSVGVVTYILVCGFPPFYNENIPLLFESILKADFDFPMEDWEHISDDCMDFIDQLLVVDPSQRLTAQQALKHSWLQGNAPPTPLLKAQSSMINYTAQYRQMSQLMGPSSVEDSSSESSTESPDTSAAPGSMEDLGALLVNQYTL